MEGLRQQRIRVVGERDVATLGDYVLYWMQIQRRLTHNHALDHALEMGRALGKPVVVYEGLRLDYPWASRRLHRFILDGMADNARRAGELGLAYWPFVARSADDSRDLLVRLAARSALVVTDEAPVFIVPGQTRRLAERTDRRVVAVDGCSVVPLSMLGPPPAAAAHLRFRLLKAFAGAFRERAAAEPDLRRVPRARLDPPFEPARLRDLGDLLASLPLDGSVPEVAARGGATAGRARLAGFLERGLGGYASDRGTPRPPGLGHASGLSPYLHFGHVGVEEIVARVLERAGDPEGIRVGERRPGERVGRYAADDDCHGFLDQVVTWRDTGFCWAWKRRTDARSLERALPAWARATLEAHRGDARDVIYSAAELEAGQTGDPLWTAAQRELVATGGMQSYLRMLWGKRVIGWSRSPEEAYRVLVHLNNKYALDGRDPNSYSGILWCFGLFDRPFPGDRPVTGTIRPMSSERTAKKFDLAPYLAWVDTLPAPASRGAG